MRTSTITFVVVSVFVAGLAFGADKRIVVPPGAKPGDNYGCACRTPTR